MPEKIDYQKAAYILISHLADTMYDVHERCNGCSTSKGNKHSEFCKPNNALIKALEAIFPKMDVTPIRVFQDTIIIPKRQSES